MFAPMHESSVAVADGYLPPVTTLDEFDAQTDKLTEMLAASRGEGKPS